MEVEESKAEMPEKSEKGMGRPEFKRVALRVGKQLSTQDFFRRGNGNRRMHCTEDSNDDVRHAWKAGREGSTRALPLSGSEPPTAGGNTLSGTPPAGEGEAGMEGSKELEGMDVAEDDWRKMIGGQRETTRTKER